MFLSRKIIINNTYNLQLEDSKVRFLLEEILKNVSKNKKITVIDFYKFVSLPIRIEYAFIKDINNERNITIVKGKKNRVFLPLSLNSSKMDLIHSHNSLIKGQDFKAPSSVDKMTTTFNGIFVNENPSQKGGLTVFRGNRKQTSLRLGAISSFLLGIYYMGLSMLKKELDLLCNIKPNQLIDWSLILIMIGLLLLISENLLELRQKTIEDYVFYTKDEILEKFGPDKDMFEVLKELTKNHFPKYYDRRIFKTEKQ